MENCGQVALNSSLYIWKEKGGGINRKYLYFAIISIETFIEMIVKPYVIAQNNIQRSCKLYPVYDNGTNNP